MEEKVKLNDGSEIDIKCKFLGGRRAFRLGPEVLKIKELKQTAELDAEGKPLSSAVCEMNSAVDICWPFIVVESPQWEKVCVEDMQRIFEKYAKKDIDYVVKKNLENFQKI